MIRKEAAKFAQVATKVVYKDVFYTDCYFQERRGEENERESTRTFANKNKIILPVFEDGHQHFSGYHFYKIIEFILSWCSAVFFWSFSYLCFITVNDYSTHIHLCLSFFYHLSTFCWLYKIVSLNLLRYIWIQYIWRNPRSQR